MKYPAKITPQKVRALSMATRVKLGYFGILPKNNKPILKKGDRVSFRDDPESDGVVIQVSKREVRVDWFGFKYSPSYDRWYSRSEIVPKAKGLS